VFRLHVAMRGVRNDSPLTRGAMRASMEGVVAGLPWLLRPLALPFIGAAFGLFAWLAVPLAGAGAVRLGGERARLIRLLLGFCAAWVGVNFYLLSDFLWLLPRYMLVLVPVLALAGGLAADALFPRTLPGWVRAAALAMAAVALLGAALRDDGLMFGERALASFVAQTSAPVVTDPGTYTGAWWLLHVEGREGQVRPGWPVHGGVWFANAQPRRTGLGGLITPGADWPVLARYVQPPRAMTRWLRASGVLGVLPPALALRLAPVRREAVAYLVP
jgi:hypothetical protein